MLDNIAKEVGFEPKTFKKIIRYALVGLLGLFILIAIAKGIRIIQPGFEGVAVTLGSAQDNSLSEGMHLVIPFITTVHPVDTRTQKLQAESFEAASQDLQQVRATIVVNYNLRKDNVVTLYREIGMSYASIVITPGINEVYKAVVATFTAEQLITQRQQVSERIRTILTERLAPYGIIITQVNITTFDFSNEFNRAIEMKVIAEQEALRAENELVRIRVEAEQALARAEGQANAIMEKAKAEAESLRLRGEAVTPMVVLLDFVDKWNGTPIHTLLIGGDGVVPILDLGGNH